MRHEDGFHFHALPAASGESKSLIVILHGYGSHPDKFVKWGKKMQADNPDADVLVVRGPIGTNATPEQKAAHRMTGDDDLYAWRVTKGRRLQWLRTILAMTFNRVSVADDLNGFIGAQLEKRGLKDENLAVVGFSQGGLMAVLASVRRRRACAAVVCHSGFVPPGVRVSSKPEVLMLMGTKDEFFMPDSLKKKKGGKSPFQIRIDHAHSVARLKKAGVPVTEKTIDGQTHRVTEESWRAATDFVTRRLKHHP